MCRLPQAPLTTQGENSHSGASVIHALLAAVSPAEMEPDMQEEGNSLLQHITEQKAFEVSIWDGPKNKCAV